MTDFALGVLVYASLLALYVVVRLVMRRKRIWKRIMDWLDRDDDPLRRDDPYEP